MRSPPASRLAYPLVQPIVSCVVSTVVVSELLFIGGRGCREHEQNLRVRGCRSSIGSRPCLQTATEYQTKFKNVWWLNNKGEFPEEFRKKQIDLLDQIPSPDAMLMLRSQRNYKLSVCDFRVLPDYSGDDQEEWIAYRKALKDLPGRIDSGEIPRPTLNEELRLNEYAHWPKEPGKNNLFPEGF